MFDSCFVRVIVIIDMRTIALKSVVWKEGKQYVSQCLNVDVSSFGETKKDALANLKEALELYYEEVETPHFTLVEHADIASLRLQHA